MGWARSSDVSAYYTQGDTPTHFVLCVADSGEGMPDSVNQQIFQPFFSTKGKKNGTGLGLTIVKAIVEEAEGSIEIQSVPGQGSLFTVMLPTS